MIVVDVNVLVAAHRRDHALHARALGYLTGILETDDVIVPDAVWSGFLRIVTHPRVFDRPSTLAVASAFVRDVVTAEGYRPVGALVDGVEPFLRVCATAAATGNLVPDAYIAAVAIAHGCPVATFDRDFGRFDGVRVVTPA